MRHLVCMILDLSFQCWTIGLQLLQLSFFFIAAPFLVCVHSKMKMNIFSLTLRIIFRDTCLLATQRLTAAPAIPECADANLPYLAADG